MTTLMEQREAAFKAASALIDKVKAGDESAVAEAEAKMAEVKEIDAKMARVAKADALIDAIGKVEGEDSPPDSAGAKSLGEFAAKSIGQQLKSVGRGAKFSLSTPEFKAAADVQVTPSSVVPTLTTFDTNIVSGVRRRLTVADLLGSESISGTAITYFVEGALEGDFALVGENGQKPQLHYADPTAVTEALKKIAGFIKESDEIIEDLPWFVSVINGRLLYNLGLFEENQLLSGSGTGANLTGILNRSGVQTETAADKTDNADALFRAITKTALNSGIDADGVVINPTDYQALRLSKDGNGQYFGGGFFAGQYGQGGITEQPPLWGLRTVVTPAIAAGTALVGAFAQAGSVIRKGGVRVESTNSDEDDFTNNRVTIRAEERLALAVRRPSGFVKVTFSAADPA